MKFLPTIIALLLLTPLAHAEVYKWEDAQGVHYTDNPLSVPEKYRKKVHSENREQIRDAAPRITQQKMVVPQQAYQSQVYQENLGRQQRAAESMKHEQATARAQSTQTLKNAFATFAGFMLFWALLGLSILVAWIATIVDIVRSEFENPSNKTVWMILVLFIPILGMILYYLMGSSQKSSSGGYKSKYEAELLGRLKQNSADKDFDIGV
ncbi:MAG: DUF4124 domain-containing protein [Desulfuromonadales bacterium]|nr:MAG: DUF4124 domain-containing protein [Desulfuromonadales bacterium]